MKRTGLLLALVIAACSPDGARDPFSLGRVVNIAHRGGAFLAPENTLEAFRNAIEIEADVLELDLRITADGVPVLIHDDSVDRTCDGTGLVKDLTLAELQQLDAAYYFGPDDGYPLRGTGVKVPTLEEFLVEFRSEYWVADIKDNEYDLVVRLLDLINGYSAADRVDIASPHTEALDHARQLAPDIRTAMSVDESLAFFLEGAEPRGGFIQTPMETVDQDLVDFARERGVQIHPYVVNTVGDMERFIEMEVEAIITDSPDRLKSLL